MCVLEGHFGCYAVNDVCHFGPQVLEDVGDMYPRFLCWLPKYHLSMPSKCSLQVWRMVIDNLTIDDVIFFFFVLGVLCLVEGLCDVFFLCYVV